MIAVAFGANETQLSNYEGKTLVNARRSLKRILSLPKYCRVKVNGEFQTGDYVLREEDKVEFFSPWMIANNCPYSQFIAKEEDRIKQFNPQPLVLIFNSSNRPEICLERDTASSNCWRLTIQCLPA